MCRYIDAGTARQHLTDRLIESALNNVGIKADADDVFRDIAENRLPIWIDELQTCDVQEVRRGRWIRTGEDGYCSVCKCDMPMFRNDWEWEYTETPYCPNCGARMEATE